MKQKNRSNQLSIRTPERIVEINNALIIGRIDAGEAQGLLDQHYSDWLSVAGQYRERRAYVHPDFVVRAETDDFDQLGGYIGSLTIAEVCLKQTQPNPSRVVEYEGHAIVASFFKNRRLTDNFADVIVSYPYYNPNYQRAQFFDNRL